ncbi:MAG: right-handed parallel beta-helix repeat-containing protein [Pseudomonadota bacterium]
MAKTINVSNASQLASALSSASAGDTIRLASGDYGSFAFNNHDYSGYVTVTSANPGNPATFEDIDIKGSSYLKIDNVHVDNSSNGSPSSRVVDIDNGSHHIIFSNSEVNGSVDNTTNYNAFQGHYGIYTGGTASNIRIEGNDIHDVKNGIVGLGSDDIEIVGNTLNRLGNDGMKFAGVDGILIENNVGPRLGFKEPDAHLDFIQFQGSSENIVIRGNVYLPGNQIGYQAIFLDDGFYKNVLVEQNILYTGVVQGVWVTDGSGVVVRDNTILNMPGGFHKATAVSVPSGSQVTNNIISGGSGKIEGSNVRVQHTNPGADYHYSDLFVNATEGLGISLADLRPVPGSLAESKGAIDRLLELLNEGPPVEYEDEPPAEDPGPPAGEGPAPDTPPAAEEPDVVGPPPPEGDVFYALPGKTTFNGLSDKVVEIGHNGDFEVGSATIALTFNATAVNGQFGLISKDASGFAGGDHLTAYIENGKLHVRFQDNDSSKVVTVNGIQAGKDYDLQISFGGGAVSVWLNGEVVGGGQFLMDWLDNVQTLQIGANGWASGSGQDGFVSVFSGDISDVLLVEGVVTPERIAELQSEAAGEPPAEEPPAEEPPAEEPPAEEPPAEEPPAEEPPAEEPPAEEPPAEEPPAEEPPAEEPPVVDDAAAIFALPGTTFFDGHKRNVVEVEHDGRFEVSSATISFSFSALLVDGRNGLLTKDASGYDGGDHLAVYLENGSLIARFQDGATDRLFKVDGITPGRDYDVELTFGEGFVSASLDGQVFGASRFDVDWLDNNQALQVGALGWSSASGETGFANPFEGSITDLRIVEGVQISEQASAPSIAQPSAQTEDESDAVIGSAAGDELIGAAGADSIDGVGGNDTIYGGKGGDLLVGSAGDDVIMGLRGKDNLDGGSGDDLLVGGIGDDTIVGGTGNDILKGSGGSDHLFGGAGDDKLFGGNNFDKLTGGEGFDEFSFATGDRSNLIKDFEKGIDKIVIESGASSFGQLDIGSRAGDAFIKVGDYSIRLQGISETELEADDFLFG